MEYVSLSYENLDQSSVLVQSNGSKISLTLKFNHDEFSRFLESWKTWLSLSPKSELKIELPKEPQQWTLYFQIRSGESKFLAAHPDEKSWVGTIYLPLSSAEKITEILVNAPQTLDLSAAVGKRSSFSNLTLILTQS